MPRLIRLGQRYLAQASKAGVIPGSRRGAAVSRTVAALASATLPGAADYEAPLPPVGRAWVRHVLNENIWLWFRFNDQDLILVTVTTSPPVPLT